MKIGKINPKEKIYKSSEWSILTIYFTLYLQSGIMHSI